jgi:hypothetical protein
VLMRTLNFGVAREKYCVRVSMQKFDTAEKYWCAGACTKFNIAHGVHTHSNGAWGVCSIGRVQRSWLECAQYE